MKNKYTSIKILTLLAIVSILLLQGIWGTHVYKLTEKQIQINIDELLKISINRELLMREKLLINSLTNEVVGESTSSYEEGDVGNTEILLQEFFTKKGYPPNLIIIDSIFNSEISKKNIHSAFIINHVNPQTGKILETTDSHQKDKLHGAMSSTIIPIRRDGSEGVQVLMISPYQAVFRQMWFVLGLSFMLVVLLGYIYLSVRNALIKEKKLRRLQTDFSHALIHDMATPLQTIAQTNSLLGNEKLYSQPEKRAKYLAVAQQQILNLQALTDRILTLARAEKAELSLNITSVNLTTLIPQLIDKFTLQAKKPVEFISQLPDSFVFVNADSVLLQNALSNLIDNAIKYSGESVKIIIQLLQNENGTFIHVKDNGYGISAKDQQKIFAQFERGKAVERHEAKGFGLGLAYVKSVMEAHHGTVNLFSHEGSGTEFVLYMPPEMGHESETQKTEQL